MSTIRRTVRTQASPDRVFAYLSDFTRTEEWDPGTVSTERVSGDGSVGTRYHNVSRFMGRETELEYTVIDLDQGTLVRLRGEGKSVTAIDTMRITPDGEGSRVDYTAEFDWKGVAKVAAPLLGPALTKLGDEAEEGLQRSLDALVRT
jgi:carbon monoxide dehydrogenase subunit G